MRKNDEIQLGEINVFCLYVRRENVAIIARIEQDALAGNLYKRREAPVLSHRSVLAERIVEDRDTVLGLGSSRRSDCGGRHHQTGDCACQKQLHELCHYKFLLSLQEGLHCKHTSTLPVLRAGALDRSVQCPPRGHSLQVRPRPLVPKMSRFVSIPTVNSGLWV